MPVLEISQTGGIAIKGDLWRRVRDEEELPRAGAILVSLARLKRDRAAIAARGAPAGLALQSHERARELGEDAGLFGLVELHLPKFRDGRAFSAARLLRERYGFRGTIRAAGHILPDQALFLARCGVNEILLAGASRLGAFAAAMRAYSVAMQPTGSSWPSLRRRPAAPSFAQAAE